ncbi:carnitine dehydratase [Aeromicrobium sp. PE09-221]|uniref:CaiB/BaiF CoA transferase family protein n=1 Tax=Aeromicrobium sp. PE09-221 TaxID=1898043 RepID=UPI000B3E6875|nr:CaiB/BaiF CoA-transferase family protein [Aeromicrobium sp. PE09-221]OUZ07334.1 carnitine dehydratase [Aeromicrobium sp. PE09-221]
MHNTSFSSTSRPPTVALPLDGVLVVSCEQAVAAPFATRQLADLGARVIKVERPGRGDFARDYDETVLGQSSHFVWLNRSKESIALDLKDPSALQVMRALVEQADVFVQNLAPGAADRLGLSADELRAGHDRLITCSINGYGSRGPMRDAKAYDLLIQAEAGLVSITGTQAEPAKSGIPVADIGAGMYAFSGILAALYERERTGVGTTLEVSLFDALVEWMGYPLYYSSYGGEAPPRTGTSHAAIAPYGTFEAGDGTNVVLSVQNEREWRSFCRGVLRAPEMATDSRFESGAARVRHREELDALIVERFSTVTGPELTGRLEEAGIAHARLRDLHEVVEHPQLSSRDRWRTVASPAGPVRATLPPISFAGHEPRMDPIPDVGEHGAAILQELGIAPAVPS